MRASEAREVMLVRAAEDAASDGALVPADAAERATRQAKDAGAEMPFGFLAARGAELMPELVQRWPRAGTLLSEGVIGGAAARRAKGLAIAALVGALVFGLLSDRISAGKEVNILAVPLLGLVAWNLVVYVAMLVRRLGRRGGRAIFEPLLENLLGAIEPGGGSREVAAERRFREFALPSTWPPLVCRARGVLHAAAAVAALGIVAGMYARGLAFEYRATFESTFLSEAAAQKLLDFVLWPASAATGFSLAVPPVTGEAAAPWLHLYALLAAIVIIVPRLILAIGAFIRARVMAGDFALPADQDWDGYAAACLRTIEGGGQVVNVVPGSITPQAKVKEAVRALVADRWGGAAMIDLADPVGYGDEDDFVAAREEGETDLVFLMSLTTTPEAEAHRALVDGCLARAGGGRAILALDGSGFAARFSGLPEYARRLGERAAAWRRTMAGARLDEMVVFGTDPVKPGWQPLPGEDASEPTKAA